MPSNQTANYALSQWSRTDQVKMEDFNADNAKIDAALGALAAVSAKHGNCSIGTFTYRGTGKYGPDSPTRITFPQKPIMYVILGGNLMIGGTSRAIHTYSISGGCVVGGIGTSWSGNTVSFYDDKPDDQMNDSYTEYQVIAFYAQ